MTERELNDLRRITEEYQEYVSPETTVKLIDEIERLREGLLDAYSNVKGFFGSGQDAYDTCQAILKVLGEG